MPVDLDPRRFTLLDIEHRDDGVSTVVLNRPAKRNALNVATIDELVDFFAAAPRSGSQGRRPRRRRRSFLCGP